MSITENTRFSPRQQRSHATVQTILEAAAQLLESAGEEGFNTNAVAERAGVSIGTIYRYFPEKRAIMVALARQEMAAVSTITARALSGGTSDVAPDRAAIRAFLQAFNGRATARRAAVKALLTHADPDELAAGFGTAAVAIVDSEGRPVDAIKAFVLSRALHGAMRAAVFEGADFLLSRKFEDELVRLARAYLGFPPGSSAPNENAPPSEGKTGRS